jgi:hypothetical protein
LPATFSAGRAAVFAALPAPPLFCVFFAAGVAVRRVTRAIVLTAAAAGLRVAFFAFAINSPVRTPGVIFRNSCNHTRCL